MTMAATGLDETVAYLQNSIARLENGLIDGSHAEGVFGKAAKLFEAHLRDFVAQTTAGSALDYDRDVRPRLKGEPAFDKLTLGQLAHALREVERASPSLSERMDPFKNHIPYDWAIKHR